MSKPKMKPVRLTEVTEDGTYTVFVAADCKFYPDCTVRAIFTPNDFPEIDTAEVMFKTTHGKRIIVDGSNARFHNIFEQ